MDGSTLSGAGGHGDARVVPPDAELMVEMGGPSAPTMQAVGALVRRLRVRAGLSLASLAAAAELNYRPDFFARTLRMCRTFTIGVIAEDQSQVPLASDQYPVQALSPDHRWLGGRRGSGTGHAACVLRCATWIR